MFELTNEQRRCFAIPEVLDTWEKIKVKKGPYDTHDTYAYLDGEKIVKVIEICERGGEEKYLEYGVDQTLSEDRSMLLPKTAKGKPQPFSAPRLNKATPIGMSIWFGNGNINLVNNDSDQSFYRSSYEGIKIASFSDFDMWVADWCKNTGVKEMEDLAEFASRKKIHQKFKEGDFFRFKINRTLYGYGRILVDYAQMRKQKIAFWDVFAGKPLCVAVYHVVSEKPDLTVDELVGMKALPSQMIMDNIFYYGECQIIGNLPLKDGEIEPTVHYGKSIDIRTPNQIHYQCGKVFITIKNRLGLVKAVEENRYFINNGVGFSLDVKLPILMECIKDNSNEPYWKMVTPYQAERDLRNPKYAQILERVKRQIGVK